MTIGTRGFWPSPFDCRFRVRQGNLHVCRDWLNYLRPSFFLYLAHAFDPRRSLLLVNRNNLPAKVRMIPAGRFWDEAAKKEEDGQYTLQFGAPYAICRAFLFAKADHLPRVPCAPPVWGTLSVVDMTIGSIRWQVPLGSVASGNAAIPAGCQALAAPSSRPANWCLSPERKPIRPFVHSTSRPARKFGRLNFPTAAGLLR